MALAAAPPSPLLRGSQQDRLLPWAFPGFCPNETAEQQKTRLQYLSAFVPVPIWETVVYLHRDAPEVARFWVVDQVEATHRDAVRALPLPTPPAVVYVHPSPDALQAHSCAGREALAYYDGAIHLAPDRKTSAMAIAGQLRSSLRHEYVHHVLVSNGVGRPIWLQEALAMSFAGEHTGRKPPDPPIAFERMVERMPDTATPEFETSFYKQAARMLGLLQLLCSRNREGCADVDLVRALRDGRATPETLFEWAVAARAREGTGATPRALWEDYLAHGEDSPLVRAARRTWGSTQSLGAGSVSRRR